MQIAQKKNPIYRILHPRQIAIKKFRHKTETFCEKAILVQNTNFLHPPATTFVLINISVADSDFPAGIPAVVRLAADNPVDIPAVRLAADNPADIPAGNNSAVRPAADNPAADNLAVDNLAADNPVADSPAAHKVHHNRRLR